MLDHFVSLADLVDSNVFLVVTAAHTIMYIMAHYWYVIAHHRVHGISWWYIMVHHDISWSIMYIMAHYWYVIGHHRVHGISWWYIMVHHDISWSIMTYHGPSCTSWHIIGMSLDIIKYMGFFWWYTMIYGTSCTSWHIVHSKLQIVASYFRIQINSIFIHQNKIRGPVGDLLVSHWRLITP